MRVRVLLNCQIKGFEYELVVVVPANCTGNDISALQVQNGTELGFLALRAIFHLYRSTALMISSFLILGIMILPIV